MTLSWPVVISSSLTMLGPTIDMIWVGKLGPDALAAVSLSGMVIMVVNALMMGLFTSLRAMVARYVGAGDHKSAIHAFQQAFVIGIVFSIFMAAIGLFLSHQILNLFGAQPEVLALAIGYNRIQFVGMVTMTMRMISETTMQSSGDTMTAMRIGLFFRGLHMLLCPFLVFGWWIFPQLGVNGAATMDIVSQGIGGLVGMLILFGGRSHLKVTMAGFRIDMNNIWRQLKIGIPASINSMLRSFVGVFMLKFISPFGTDAIAAYGLSQRVENFMDIGASGLGTAAGVLAGQNLGAKKPERAEKTGWLAGGLSMIIMAVAICILLAWPEQVVHLFNNDPTLVKIGANFLRISAVGFLVMGPAAVFTNVLNGVGDTTIPLIASFTTMWVFQLPLAYFMPKIGNIGVYGIRWAMAITLAMRAITYVIYFRGGRWKRKRV
ncbi:MAG: MATE family efflux transporter [Dehalococcoidales bacterium]|nr:MATE family efflux transporter [Dehalococcoidales bacterium]